MAISSKETISSSRKKEEYIIILTQNGRKTRTKEKKRLRVRYSPKPDYFGYIVSDSVERITDGIKDYFISAVDAKMKFGLTINYKRLTSANMKDFYLRFKDIYPGEITAWQTDNGSENFGEFDRQLKEDGIPHFCNRKIGV